MSKEIFSRPECPFNYCDTKPPHMECLKGCHYAEGNSQEECFRKALKTPAEVWYPCGCKAIPGSPKYCPEHGQTKLPAPEGMGRDATLSELVGQFEDAAHEIFGNAAEFLEKNIANADFVEYKRGDVNASWIFFKAGYESHKVLAHPTPESGTDNSVTPADDLTADDNWCPDCGEPRELCLCTNFNFNWDARAKKVYWRTCSTCGDIDRSELAKAMKYAAEEYVKYLDRRKSESGRVEEQK